MAEFVDEKVTNQGRSEEEKILIQADGSPAGIAAPTGFLAPNLNPLVAEADLGTYLGQPGDEMHPALVLQPALQEMPAALEITNIATDLKTGMVQVD